MKETIMLETMSEDIRTAAETSGPLFSGLTQFEDQKTDLLTSSPPMEQDYDITTMGTTNDKTDEHLDNKLSNLRTDPHDVSNHEMPQTLDTELTKKNLPAAQSPHQMYLLFHLRIL